MNYKQTREQMIDIDPEQFSKMPEEWQWRIDLSGAHLYGVDLVGAHLIGTNLRRANLIRADLSGAHLYGADLSGAHLYGADLIRADLRRANLSGTKLSWTSHDLLAELLRREANGDLEKIKLAGLVLIQRQWCWDEFLEIEDPLKPWALKALAKYHVEGDDAPEVIVELAKREAQ